ncbi:TIGR02680 family protein [Peptococcaceae bacterium 1198_IL3148]
MKENRWQLHRAGILNFWYYDEEEFHFADGKLLLRGSNGSGKSVTMQSLIPVVLDGRKSPDRLDPFGSRARKMEDYLLGEKDVVDRDERTGYLYLEYKRQGLDQYLTTGIGLRAKRYGNLDFWGFIVSDNRRIGKELLLYQTDYSLEDGREQKIPLSRRQLETRVGNGGRVVKSQREYMELVNKHVFGFENIEAYEELIKLLIQLRSPKLSKEFKPTAIYDILTKSLPSLSDEELRPLSDTIENMDQTKQQLEQLERERKSLSRLCQQYDYYNQYVLAEKAEGLQQSSLARDKLLKQEQQLQQQIAELQQQQWQLKSAMDDIKAEQQALEIEEKSLEKHEAFNAEEEKKTLEQKINDLEDKIKWKEENLGQKQSKERELVTKVSQQEQKISANQKSINELLDELEINGLEASFENHGTAVNEFKNNYQQSYHFDLWKKEADQYTALLDNVLQTLREQTKANDGYKAVERDLAEVSKNLDLARNEENKWDRFFEEEKETLLRAFHQWLKENEQLVLSNQDIQLVSRRLLDIFTDYQAEEVKEPVTSAYQYHYSQLQRLLADKELQIDQNNKEITAKELELDQWKKRKDAEPTRHADTLVAREKLSAQGIPHLPFYSAVEFHDYVTVEQRERIEAAITQMGLLDALIVPEKYLHTVGQHDRVIKPNPHIFAHTLTEFLYPTPVEGQAVTAADIDNVLRTILIDDTGDSSAVIREDGTYQLSLIKGHAPRGVQSIYIGLESRRQYRLQVIEQLKTELTDLQAELHKLQGEKRQLEAQQQQLQDEYRQFPSLRDVRTAYDSLSEAKQQVKLHHEFVKTKNEQLKTAYEKLQQIKSQLRTLTAEINLAPTEQAYNDAKQQMQGYQKYLQQLELVYKDYVNNNDLLKNYQTSLADIIADVDELKGELNVLIGELKVLRINLEQIEARLKELGAEQIRARIAEVLGRLKTIPNEILALNTKIQKTIHGIENAEDKLVTTKEQLKYAQQLLLDWQQVFLDDFKLGFVIDGEQQLPQDLNQMLSKSKQILQQYGHLLRDKHNDRVNVENNLNRIFYQERDILVEYRLFQEQVLEVADLPEQLSDPLLQVQFSQLRQKSRRMQLLMEYEGKKVTVYYVLQQISKDIELQRSILSEKDRELYEEIIMNSVGRIIRNRINRAELWVKQIDNLMQQRDTSSGLTFSLRWKPCTADYEEELDTKDLVDLLRSDPRLLKEQDVERVTQHFRSKINRAKEVLADKGYGESFHQVIKDTLDYRKWFTFTLYYRREGEQRKELTNNVFYTFSGGEKAMAMYIPLFSAVYSRYLEAGKDAPYIISLDEAFAGVDENNIRDMFDLVEKLGFNYIMNSQALWGDYDTVSSLAICELVRPKNAPYVSVVRYHWDGEVKHLLHFHKE